MGKIRMCAISKETERVRGKEGEGRKKLVNEKAGRRSGEQRK